LVNSNKKNCQNHQKNKQNQNRELRKQSDKTKMKEKCESEVNNSCFAHLE